MSARVSIAASSAAWVGTGSLFVPEGVALACEADPRVVLEQPASATTSARKNAATHGTRFVKREKSDALIKPLPSRHDPHMSGFNACLVWPLTPAQATIHPTTR